jgi:mono/diheme cytochrome c family protein
VTARTTRVLAAIGAGSLFVVAAGAIALASSVKGGFSARDQPSRVEALLARTMRSWSIPSAVKQLKSPVPGTTDVLTEARAHWANHCATCHANDGGGDTPMGRNLYPKAPDMRASATQGLSDGELYYIIENGIRLTGMPAWGTGGDQDKESWSLVAFIRQLPQLTGAELAEMRKLNPKSPEELQEEQEEDAFIQGNPAPGKPPDHHEHVHH